MAALRFVVFFVVLAACVSVARGACDPAAQTECRKALELATTECDDFKDAGRCGSACGSAMNATVPVCFGDCCLVSMTSLDLGVCNDRTAASCFAMAQARAQLDSCKITDPCAGKSPAVTPTASSAPSAAATVRVSAGLLFGATLLASIAL
eukprot:TRINITY_DN438_c2_g1_i1.p2 TRINITY_DN438_c2_g1~~TRINITY_DN438_c2_g1_i1.p2  ORF type:complete len:151 (+),score=35.75 TRINITY_DN438_c2_g1_i1:95-547(+)